MTAIDRSQLLRNLQSLGVDIGRFPEIPEEFAIWLAQRTPEDLERIRADVKELERMGLLPAAARSPES